MGDRNKKYLHRMATIRMQRKRILCLQDLAKVWTSDPVIIHELFIQHFRTLFTSLDNNSVARDNFQAQHHYPDHMHLLELIPNRLSQQEIDQLNLSFHEQEVKDAIFQMQGLMVLLLLSIRSIGIWWV